MYILYGGFEVLYHRPSQAIQELNVIHLNQNIQEVRLSALWLLEGVFITITLFE